MTGYPERFAASYGHWRPIVSGTVAKFLRFGDLHEGFARVKCRTCKHEFFVAFSCKPRKLSGLELRYEANPDHQSASEEP